MKTIISKKEIEELEKAEKLKEEAEKLKEEAQEIMQRIASNYRIELEGQNVDIKDIRWNSAEMAALLEKGRLN